MISICEATFPTAEFDIVETNFDNLSKEDYDLLKKNQSDMNKLMGSMEPSVKEFNKKSSIDDFFKRCKELHCLIFLLKNKNQQIVGHAFVNKMIVSGRYNLADIYLDKKHRQGGLGYYFLSNIEKQLKEKHHCKVLQLSCLANNEAGNKLYQKSGYEVIRRGYAKKL